jgi:hypothetical protein
MIVIDLGANRGLFDRAVHPLDLAIGPRMIWLGQPVIYVLLGTGELKGVAMEDLTVLYA